MADTTTTEKAPPIASESVIAKAKQEVEDFASESITVAEGYTFSQSQTLRKIDLYYSSRFLKGATDRDRFKRLFFNIVKSRTQTSAKAVDLDTKDIQVIAEEGQSYYPAWLLEKELKQYMKLERFGVFLNDLIEKWPRYGHVIVKDVDGKPMIPRLRNIVLDQAIDTIKKSPYVNEKHEYTVDEYRDIAGKKGWKNTEKVIAAYRTVNNPQILLVERYGWANAKELSEAGPADKWVKARFLIAGLDIWKPKARMHDKRGVDPIIVFSNETDEWPYRDLKWDEEDGRYLGVGVVEDLFQHQEFRNEIINLHRKSLHWSSKKIWQTLDPNTQRNLFTEADNGTVLPVNKEIVPVLMEERNLPDYNALGAEVEKGADSLAFTYDVNTGESLPSGTPFRLGAILAKAVDSYFSVKREKLGLFVRDIIFDFVIPGFKRKSNIAHIFNFDQDSDDYEHLAELVANYRVNDAVVAYYEKHGFFPSQFEIDAERERVRQEERGKKAQFLEIPDGFYDDVKYRIDIRVTNEQQDVPTDLESLLNILQTVASNPAILQDPFLRSVFEQAMNMVGKSPIGLTSMQGQKQQMQQPATPQNVQIPQQKLTPAPEASRVIPPA